MKKGGFSMRQLSRTDGQTNGRTDGRTNEQTYFFLPFPKTKPLVPRGNYINLFHLCMCVSVFVGEGRGEEEGGN